MWTTEIPTEVGFYYWRVSLTDPYWIVREIREDHFGLYSVNLKAIKLEFIGGVWQKVPDPLKKA